MVRPLPHDRAGPRGALGLARRQGQDREAQHRREPEGHRQVRHSVDPDLDALQERPDGLPPGRCRAEKQARAVDHHLGLTPLTRSD